MSKSLFRIRKRFPTLVEDDDFIEDDEFDENESPENETIFPEWDTTCVLYQRRHVFRNIKQSLEPDVREDAERKGIQDSDVVHTLASDDGGILYVTPDPRTVPTHIIRFLEGALFTYAQ